VIELGALFCLLSVATVLLNALIDIDFLNCVAIGFMCVAFIAAFIAAAE